MLVLLGTVLVASLLGSLHCVGMCGPFALIAGADPEKRQAAVVPTVAYSAGRLVSYSIVGFIFGSLGLALNQGTSFVAWQQTATYVAGALMILVGVIALARHFGMRLRLPPVLSPVNKMLQAGFAKTKQMKPLPRAMTIGMLTSLMPCGWLYTFAVTAAGTGSPFWGTLLMVVFWAGTVPIMAALMLGFHKISQGVQKQVPVMMASLVILLGVFTLTFRAPILLNQAPTIVQGAEALTEQVKEIDHSELPCCSDGSGGESSSSETLDNVDSK
ncbi:MAG: sulfite exporter TauE/SafE family protein [Mariniblastus sp.]|nr:sulfite exporter TauE/SafE family protein [Mariniblastus sp.]